MKETKRTVLIIDDAVDIAQDIRRVLEGAGYSVYLAYDAKEGLEKFKALKPQLVLIDLVLPQESGFRIAQVIQSLPGYKKTSLIAISFKREDVDKHVAAKSGFVAYIEKPIDNKTLLFQLEDILRTHLARGDQ